MHCKVRQTEVKLQFYCALCYFERSVCHTAVLIFFLPHFFLFTQYLNFHEISFNRQRDQERKEAEEATQKEIEEWEKSLLAQAAPTRMETM